MSYRVPPPGGSDVGSYIRRCAEQSGISRLLDDRLTALLGDRSARNPRRIKRLINGFLLECRLNPLWQDFGAEATLRTLLLQLSLRRLLPDFGGRRPGERGTRSANSSPTGRCGMCCGR
ncbi:hypothetical protein [Streptomyces sp. H27-D2]|uniref:hypothetical protein n=1 Tax=Streptomyces sp. H27-D2 TaxID=3046304 RepID=UPI002DB6C7C0|nr:hypothetical protein [Streptomyces sp. H27-D2]MEC4017154.1 hypothetical protein [Streptomyces sp. H27-D2]